MTMNPAMVNDAPAKSKLALTYLSVSIFKSIHFSYCTSCIVNVPFYRLACIPDKSVPCRAKASLPATHLWLRNNDNESEVLGVFARRRIPLRARFGPLEGIRKCLPQDTTPTLSENGPLFLIHTENGDYTIDISDESN